MILRLSFPVTPSALQHISLSRLCSGKNATDPSTMDPACGKLRYPKGSAWPQGACCPWKLSILCFYPHHPLTIILPSFYHHFTIILPSFYRHFTIILLSLCHNFTMVSQVSSAIPILLHDIPRIFRQDLHASATRRASLRSSSKSTSGQSWNRKRKGTNMAGRMTLMIYNGI